MPAVPDLNPPARLLMGPGPINADPRVLRAMATPLVGQFDPSMTSLMGETMALYREVFRTRNRWTLLVDATARGGIEAALVSLIEPGDRVLVPIFGRFGHLLAEICRRCEADVVEIETEWGKVFDPAQIEDAVRRHRPKLIAICHGDTSTTMLQPLAEIGAIARRHDALVYVDTTASLGGNDLRTDDWHLDVVTAGLQKCLSGPSGSAPITIGERAEAAIYRRRHVEAGIATSADRAGPGVRIRSNYFDLAMVMDYWSEKRLNHHTEATTMLYGARECARILVDEGLDAAIARHKAAGDAMAEGLLAMGLRLFGERANKMANVVGVYVPEGVSGDAVRGNLLSDFAIEIGTSFGPLHGKIWRIGTMGYNARKDCVLTTLAALENVLLVNGARIATGQAVPAALKIFRIAEEKRAKAAE
ncbi:MAG: aminotransferase class V-fold PLP-dependent enzyme [Alphaproteobacteria bacterium]|nr:aminotransferase class V-fold PLP-dependent enzyme [Alphaproteobacteria bacterium]